MHPLHGVCPAWRGGEIGGAWGWNGCHGLWLEHLCIAGQPRPGGGLICLIDLLFCLILHMWLAGRRLRSDFWCLHRLWIVLMGLSMAFPQHRTRAHPPQATDLLRQRRSILQVEEGVASRPARCSGRGTYTPLRILTKHTVRTETAAVKSATMLRMFRCPLSSPSPRLWPLVFAKLQLMLAAGGPRSRFLNCPAKKVCG